MILWITVGTKAVAGAIYEGRLTRTLPSGYGAAAAHSFSLNLNSLGDIQPLKLRWEVIHAISSSIQVLCTSYMSSWNFLIRFQTIWMVCAPCLGVALLVGYILNRCHLILNIGNSSVCFYLPCRMLSRMRLQNLNKSQQIHLRPGRLRRTTVFSGWL